jgi:predicted HicB family RNase H-like nuclease
MNITTLFTYQTKIEYDGELDLFRGEILLLNGGADFYGKSCKHIRAQFKRSLQVFLEVCEEKGHRATLFFSGKFNLRTTSELHETLAIKAHGEGKTINTLILEALQEQVAQPR